MVEPALVMVPETTTPMYRGTVAGGIALSAGLAVHVPAHEGGWVLGLEAKPLKLAGAVPPLKEFSVDQIGLQNVTAVPAALFWLPITKEPRARNAKTMVVALAEDGR